MQILKYHLLGLEEHLQMRGMLVDTSGSALVHKMHKLECNRQSSKTIPLYSVAVSSLLKTELFHCYVHLCCGSHSQC